MPSIFNSFPHVYAILDSRTFVNRIPFCTITLDLLTSTATPRRRQGRRGNLRKLSSSFSNICRYGRIKRYPVDGERPKCRDGSSKIYSRDRGGR